MLVYCFTTPRDDEYISLLLKSEITNSIKVKVISEKLSKSQKQAIKSGSWIWRISRYNWR